MRFTNFKQQMSVKNSTDDPKLILARKSAVMRKFGSAIAKPGVHQSTESVVPAEEVEKKPLLTASGELVYLKSALDFKDKS